MIGLKKSALCVAFPVAFLGGVALESTEGHAWLAHGPIQEGHAEVACAGCHTPSPGTLRQQLQAKVHFLLGARPDDADFGKAEVTSETCLDCHARPNERHPIYRFREPRFLEALQMVQADSCLGCHSEHQNRRVETGAQLCQACHGELKVKNDPLDQPHSLLVAQDQWDSCLGCHDFHGNHVFKTPVRMASRIPAHQINAYLAAAPSPYGNRKLYEAEPE